MNCPKCGEKMQYKEYVNGAYSYPIESRIIDWGQSEFEGECYGHAIKCANPECGHELEQDEVMEIVTHTLETDHSKILA